jgi:thymidylate kinase
VTAGPSWVILEGPDGAGKSTMAAKVASVLADRGPTVLQHLTSTSEWEEYVTHPRMWTRWGLNVVQDRCALSALVYDPVLRGPYKWPEERTRDSLRDVARRALVLHATADEADLAARLRERGDDLISEGMLHAILKNYWREMSWWRIEGGATVREFDTSGGRFPTRLDLELELSIGLAELARAGGA